jgi:hypothetical protein
MEHRHIHTKVWSAAAIDSALERGDLKDWRALFAAVQQDRRIAELVLKVATEHEMGGASTLARTLVERLQPGLQALKAPKGKRRAEGA